MSTTLKINPDALKVSLLEQINADLTRAAEPILQEALKKIEQEMRARLAMRLVAHIQQNMDFMVCEDRIVITLRQAQAIR